MKIAIIGHGFVGKALKNGLKENTEVFIVDPKLKTSIQDLKSFDPEVIFICVPTPMNKDASQNISIVVNVINEIIELSLDSCIVLKSTVAPNHIKNIQKMMSHLVYNPEFLREKHADEDFINSDLIIFGGPRKQSEIISKIYTDYTKCVNTNYVFTDIMSASLIKYTINSFLSTKITFFNELYDVFKASGSDESWENFIDFIAKDKRIGNSHMQVPGHDGRLGFGGACLPKDSNAFYVYSKSLNSPLRLLNEAIKINNKIRSSYDSKTTRELDQNIIFSKKSKLFFSLLITSHIQLRMQN
ncbi:MAG: hypothetical protein ACJ0FI_02845 [Gammaproteobacteria bacterium]